MKKLKHITTVVVLGLLTLAFVSGCKRTRADMNAPINPPVKQTGATNASGADAGGCRTVVVS